MHSANKCVGAAGDCRIPEGECGAAWTDGQARFEPNARQVARKVLGLAEGRASVRGSAQHYAAQASSDMQQANGASWLGDQQWLHSIPVVCDLDRRGERRASIR